MGMQVFQKFTSSFEIQTHSKEEINMKNRIPFADDPLKGEIVFDPAMYTASSEWEMISVRVLTACSA